MSLKAKYPEQQPFFDEVTERLKLAMSKYDDEWMQKVVDDIDWGERVMKVDYMVSVKRAGGYYDVMRSINKKAHVILASIDNPMDAQCLAELLRLQAIKLGYVVRGSDENRDS